MISKPNILIGFFICLLMFAGCSKETVDPNFFGSIEGQVTHGNTGKPVANVQITTSPGTDAIRTGEDGQFSFQEVPTGKYTVTAQKEGFQTYSVRISVREDRATVVDPVLKVEDEDPSTEKNIKAEATFHENFNYGPRDSVYVNVEYKFENTSTTESVGNYEVEFKIFTSKLSDGSSGPAFYNEVRKDSLAPGEQTSGTFKKYIYQFKADSVNVTGIYAAGTS